MRKNITINDIAEELDISISTVSRALKDHPKISNETKEKVFKKAKQLGYSSNNIASALAKGRSYMVGIIVPTVDKHFFARAIRGIETTLKNNGYRVIISQSNETVEDEKSCIKSMLEARVDGIITSHAMQTTDFKHYKQVLEKGITLIFFDRFAETLDTHVVAIDDLKGAYQTTKHLIDQGCKKIAYIGGFSHVHIYNQRFKGYKQALIDNDLEFDENLIFEHDMKMGSAQKLTKEILQNSNALDAIFATSDYSAMGAIQILKEHNITIPDQIAVAGFSNEDFSAFITPSLTSTEQHSGEMGRVAAQLFLNQVNEDNETSTKVSQKATLSSDLIIRDSTLKVKPNA